MAEIRMVVMERPKVPNYGIIYTARNHPAQLSGAGGIFGGGRGVRAWWGWWGAIRHFLGGQGAAQFSIMAHLMP